MNNDLKALLAGIGFFLSSVVSIACAAEGHEAWGAVALVCAVLFCAASVKFSNEPERSKRRG